MVDNPVSPPAGVPERPSTTEPSPPPPSGEILAVPPKKSSRSKIILAALSLLIILASLPIAVYLVKQRQEMKIEAVGYGDQAHSDYELTIGPDYLDYVAKGYGTQKNSSPTISLSIPANSTVYKAYAVWGGERKNVPQDTEITIGVNGGAAQTVTANLASWDHLNQNYNTYQNSYLADITSLLPADTTSFSFAIGSFLENYIDDGKGGAGHGISIIIVYKKSDNLYREIKIKLWGEYIRGNTSANMVFGFPDIDTSQSSNLKTAFFVGEAEGAEDPAGRPRPNFLFYNGTQLNPTDGTPFFGYSSDDGHWWDTRLTGDDLPAITASGNSATFWVDSPDETKDPEKRVGDSIVWNGGIMAYAVTPPVLTPTPTPTPPLFCTDLTASPSADLLITQFGNIIGGDTVLFTCIGTSSTDNPINHFEFRVQIDGGEWENLGTAPASGAGEEYQGQKIYTIPDYGCYKVECRACTSSDSSECTVWGQAQ